MIERLAVMRLHDGVELAPIVIPRVAAVADAMAFVVHDVRDQRQVEVAAACGKCRGFWMYQGKWDGVRTNHRTLSLCAAIADGFRPFSVMLWDEDEAPPERFLEDYAEWKEVSTERPAMKYKCVWAWGDLQHVIGSRCYQFGWHDKVYRWKPGLAESGFTTCNRLVAYERTPAYYARYPYLHLSTMTAELRNKRLQAAGGNREPWWDGDVRVIEWNGDMALADWEAAASEVAHAR